MQGEQVPAVGLREPNRARTAGSFGVARRIAIVIGASFGLSTLAPAFGQAGDGSSTAPAAHGRWLFAREPEGRGEASPIRSHLDAWRVHPMRYASRDGRFELLVDPGEPTGDGPAMLSMTRDGELAWSRQLDVTPFEAVIASDGRVAGYALNGGVRSWGELVVLLLDSNGVPLARHELGRSSDGPDGPPLPSPKGVLLDEASERFALRAAWPRSHDRGECWRWYDLESGRFLQAQWPKENLAAPDGTELWLTDALALDGADLFLAHWFTSPGVDSACGALFTLVDSDGRVRWRLDRPGEYCAAGKRAVARSAPLLPPEGPLAIDERPRRFALRLASERVRVEYELIAAAEANDESAGAAGEPSARIPAVPRESKADVTGGGREWVVREVARTPFEMPVDHRPAPFPTLVPRELASVELQRDEAPAPLPFERVLAWDFDGAGGFRLIDRRADGAASRLHLDADGNVLERKEIEPPPGSSGGVADGRVLGARSLGRDRWWIEWTESRSGRGPRAHFDLFDAVSGQWTPSSFWSGAAFDPESLVADPRGGYVALGRRTLVHFAVDGSLDWSRVPAEDSGRIHGVGDSVAVAPDGTVGVLAHGPRLLLSYGADGELREHIELETAWGREPNYLTGLCATPDGNFLIRDFHGEAALVVMSPVGEVLREYRSPKPEGEVTAAIADNALLAPDHVLWSCPPTGPLVWNEQGEVVRRVFARPEATVLEEPCSGKILPDGRVALVDEASGALHVWNERGERLFVGSPSEDGGEYVDSIAHVAMEVDGSIWIRTERELEYPLTAYRGWSREGEPLGLREYPVRVDFAPDGVHHWTVEYGDVAIRRTEAGPTGERAARGPDGRWLGAVESLAFGPSGEVHVLEDASSKSGSEFRLVSFTPDGRVLGSRRLPQVGRYPDLFAGGEWVGIHSGSVVHLIHLPSARALRFDCGERSYASCGISPDGRRLLCLPHEETRLDRFELPTW